jgi:hypothetical protein
VVVNLQRPEQVLHPVRWLWTLFDEELSVNELAGVLGKPAPSVTVGAIAVPRSKSSTRPERN